MSAGVGRTGADRPGDFYPTPPEVAEALALWFDQRGITLATVIDPCAGVGCLLDPWMVRGATTYGMEARGELGMVAAIRHDMFRGDGRELVAEIAHNGTPDAGASLMVVNPPFNEADDWIAMVVDAARQTDNERQEEPDHPLEWVAALVRSQWLDDGGATRGRGRYRYDSKARPTHLLRLPFRVTFDGGGKDSSTYTWAIWHRDPNPSDVPTSWAEQEIATTDEARQRWELGAAMARGEGEAMADQIPLFAGG